MKAEQIKDFLHPGQEDWQLEPKLLDDAAYEEIQLLQKRINELRKKETTTKTADALTKRYGKAS